MNNNNLLEKIKQVMCGVLISIIVNMVHLIALYVDFPNWSFYLLSFFISVFIWIIIREKELKTTLKSIGTLLLANVVTEILFFVTGLTDCFYFNVYPTATEIDIGYSLLQVGLYIYEFAGILIGAALVTATIWIKTKYSHSNNDEKFC